MPQYIATQMIVPAGTIEAFKCSFSEVATNAPTVAHWVAWAMPKSERGQVYNYVFMRFTGNE